MSYTPQAGTFPARVIDYLRTLPAGAERSSVELADELDQDPLVVANLLGYPRKAGALKARREGRVLYWSLGDGTPEALPHDYVPDEPLRSVAREPNKAPAPPAREKPPKAFRAGLWTDGTLQIERDGDLFLLTRAEAEQLRDLLRGCA